MAAPGEVVEVEHGLSMRLHGWLYVSVRGSPRERGVAYGSLIAADFAKVQAMLAFWMLETYGHPWSYFVERLDNDFAALTREQYPELDEEMAGIAEGLNANGCATTLAEVRAWNLYCSIPYWFSANGASSSASTTSAKEGGGAADRCSAFMAVGPSWTADGGIVCAHNSFADFVDGQFGYVVLDMHPSAGHRMLMQTSPGWIWSGTDFFVTAKGIVGTETTLGGFTKYAPGHPVGYRIRRAMQYGNSLDEYCDILIAHNSGDYANSWLFGDVGTNEILRLELGLAYHNVERTKDGYFIGFNAPYDPRIRNLETVNSGFYDVRRHQGARRVRLADLMDAHKGRLTVAVAQRIIADHYDVYLRREHHPCSRTVCAHYDLDAREYMSQADRPKPFAPRGALDGLVVDSTLAKNMSFLAKYGASCDTPFDKDAFCRAHRQYAAWAPFLFSRPAQPWTLFQSDMNSSSPSPSSSSTVVHQGGRRRRPSRTHTRRRPPA